MKIVMLKFISGEFVIGGLDEIVLDEEDELTDVKRDGEEYRLADLDAFTLTDPVYFAQTQQGYSFVPVMPWAKPGDGVSMEFYGLGVLSEVKDFDTSPLHADLRRGYANLVSKIQLSAVPKAPVITL